MHETCYCNNSAVHSIVLSIARGNKLFWTDKMVVPVFFLFNADGPRVLHWSIWFL